MITPLMHILSCYDEHYTVGNPVDILYLSKSDRELIVGEAKRLCNLILDETKFLKMPTDTGRHVMCTTQSLANNVFAISPFTALLLQRIQECATAYLNRVDLTDTSVEDDLSTDAIVLKMEGNPRYVYYYVYTVMQLPALTYEAKINRLNELLQTLQTHVSSDSKDVKDTEDKKDFYNRLSLHSKVEYWRGMLLSDYIYYYGVVPPEFDEKTMETLYKELRDLGFYGFVNPLQMYLEFNNSRVNRKVDIDVEDWVLEFLSKVVLSGGVS